MGFSTVVSCHAFLQGIFLTQGLNPCLLPLLHSRQILYHWPTKEAHIYTYTSSIITRFILTLTLQTNSVTMGFYVCNYYHLDAEIPPMMSQSSSVTNFKPYLSYCYSEPELSQDLDYLYSLQASDKLLPIIQADSSSPFLKITTHGDLVYLLHSHSHFSADHFGNPDFT